MTLKSLGPSCPGLCFIGCQIVEESPSSLVTLRSSKVWAAAKKAVDVQEVARLYLAPIGGDGKVEYEAVLKEVVLQPKLGDIVTEQALKRQLPETVDESLWHGQPVRSKCMKPKLESMVTCPACGHQEAEVMPEDACLYYYECKRCRALLKPKSGDCCIFCSYGDTPCPPIQLQKPGCNDE